MSRLLLVFVTEPLPGRVGTVLAKKLGSENAVRVHRALVRVLLHQLGGLEDCRIRFCFTPDDARDAVKFWILPEILDQAGIQIDPAVVEFHPQGDGDHGTRLERAFATAFAEGFEKIAMIGTDCIEISARWIHAAFAQLNTRHDVAIGPTPRGGYHLLALQRHHPALFEEIPWSPSDGYQAAVTRAAAQQITTYQLPPLPAVVNKIEYKAALLGPLGPALRRAMQEIESCGG